MEEGQSLLRIGGGGHRRGEAFDRETLEKKMTLSSLSCELLKRKMRMELCSMEIRVVDASTKAPLRVESATVLKKVNEMVVEVSR